MTGVDEVLVLGVVVDTGPGVAYCATDLGDRVAVLVGPDLGRDLRTAIALGERPRVPVAPWQRLPAFPWPDAIERLAERESTR